MAAVISSLSNRGVSFNYTFSTDLFPPLYPFSIRDRAFVSVVKAPRVILLVHNEQLDKTQTHILITTIANAWPMLLFILVTASLSGIIIWFLVSCHCFIINLTGGGSKGGGGCRGYAPPPPHPPCEMTGRLSNTTGILQKRKNPGSAPEQILQINFKCCFCSSSSNSQYRVNSKSFWYKVRVNRC